MPLYEYRCGECGHVFETLVRSATRHEEITCPACGSKSVERQISVFGVAGRGGSAGSCAPATGGG